MCAIYDSKPEKVGSDDFRKVLNLFNLFLFLFLFKFVTDLKGWNFVAISL